MAARSTLLIQLLSLATALSFSTAAQLSFIDVTDYNILSDIDDGCVAVELPGPLQFGCFTFSRAFLSSNGLVSFGKEFSAYYPVLFPLHTKIAILAPFWDDIILSEKRELRYQIFNSTSYHTIEVNNFLTNYSGNNFKADWILWVYWCHVCPYPNKDCALHKSNSFQLVVAVQGGETYSIFIYECDLIKWTLHKAVVGFNLNKSFHENHQLSKSRDVVDIDCPDGSPSNFANVVYKIGNSEKITMCNANNLTTNSSTFHWPATLPCNTATLPCPNDTSGTNATRKCSENSIWESPNVSSCLTDTKTIHTGPTRVPSPTINNITIIMPVLHNITATVSAITSTSDQNNENIEAISNILNQTATLLSNTTNLSLQEVTMIVENITEILQDIQEWPINVVETQSNNIVKSFETITDTLLNQDNVTDVTFIKQSIAFSGKRVMQSLYKGITFTASSISNALTIETVENDNNASFTNDGELATIKLPESILRIISDGDDINLAFTIYNQSILFPVQGSVQNTVVESPVIGARIGGVADGTKLSDPVIIRLTLTGTPNATDHQCVYWNFTAADGRGNWSTDGCTTIVSNTSSVTCVCDHLTNFACLVNIAARTEEPTQPPHYATLEIVSYIGTCLSLMGLVLTIITLTIFKKIRERDTSKFHIQLCLSLFFTLIVFVSGIDRVSVRAGCITVGVLIHYFALVAWMWMGAEAVLMFQKIIIVFSNITWRHILAISITCWTLPLLPVVILLSIDHDFYYHLYDNKNESGFCFIGKTIPFLFAFLLPVFLILIFNIIMYILIIRAIIGHTIRKNKRQNHSSITKSEAVRMLASYSGIMILFGITWLFAVFTFITEPDISFIVQFFFAFFNTFQGFFIFVFFVLLNGESREAWKSLLSPRSARKKRVSTISTTNKSRDTFEPNKSKGLNFDMIYKNEMVSGKEEVPE